MKNALWTLLILSTQAMSATIAVIDSGVDVEHKDLLTNIWTNSGETAGNSRDEDRNGYPDDVYGWNFAEQNNLVIDRKYLGTFSNDPYKFFALQGKAFLGQLTEEDKKWMAEKRKDPDFAKEMGKFGNFVHGTHVAGITVDGNPLGKILSVKLIPTEVKPFVSTFLDRSSFAGFINSPELVETKEVLDFRMKLLAQALHALAVEQMKMMEEIAAYVGNHGSDVANGSFGTGFNQAKMITNTIFKIIFFRDATDAESNVAAKMFLDSAISEGKKMAAAAPKTLFVFAAGNDGMNNDIYPTSPTNIQADNVISVAATYKYSYIAPFSNYGEKMVDVAAPGMLIHSQIPGDEYLKVSGTSQAAPMVANIAAQIKDVNPKLSPKEIKAILMGTVDEKSFLQTKVKSAGIVNTLRATTAATLSLTMGVEFAINSARIRVQDVKTNTKKSMFNRPFAVTPIQLTPLFK
jgi:subtilisin family serine protease